jgi:hypothetical protein
LSKEDRMQMKVIINGKAEEREVDYIQKDDNEELFFAHRELYMLPILVPVLFEGETIHRSIDGNCHIFKTWKHEKMRDGNEA